jgi:hypothetical protein
LLAPANNGSRVFVDAAAVTTSTLTINFNIGSGFGTQYVSMDLVAHSIPGVVTSVVLALTTNSPAHTLVGSLSKPIVGGCVTYRINRQTTNSTIIVG